MERAASVYAIGVGVVMAGWWALDLRRGAWNRADRSHTEVALHLAAEFLTAAALVAAGIVRLSSGERADPFLAAALGMLLYTTIVSPGYFLARRELPVVALFGVLAALTVAALLAVVL